MGRLGFLGIAERDLEIDFYFEVKIFPGRYLFTLIGKIWEASNSVTFSV